MTPSKTNPVLNYKTGSTVRPMHPAKQYPSQIIIIVNDVPAAAAAFELLNSQDRAARPGN